MRPKKILQRALGNPASLSFSEACALAEAFGFHLSRVNGSHHIFSRAGVPTLVNLQNDRGKAKAYQVRQLLKLAEEYSIVLKG